MDTTFLVDATPLEKVFWVAALVGTIFFFLRVIMMVVGGDGGDDSGDAVDDFGDGGHDAHGHADMSFQMLSINTLTAFFMMFGWSGLTCYKQFSVGATKSILVALAVGALCMFITAYLMKMTRKLTSRGSVFNINKSIGMRASVYQKIPAKGKGRIQVTVPGSNQRELDAVCASGEEIESFKTVQIVEVIDEKTVSVKEII